MVAEFPKPVVSLADVTAVSKIVVCVTAMPFALLFDILVRFCDAVAVEDCQHFQKHAPEGEHIDLAAIVQRVGLRCKISLSSYGVTAGHADPLVAD